MQFTVAIPRWIQERLPPEALKLIIQAGHQSMAGRPLMTVQLAPGMTMERLLQQLRQSQAQAVKRSYDKAFGTGSGP